MKLITAGSFRWPHPPTNNKRDWNVLQELRADWSRIDVLVRSASGRERFEEDGIVVHYLPAKLPGVAGTLGFIRAATRTSLALHRESPVGLFAASDPIAAVAGYRLRSQAGVRCLMHLQGELLSPPSGYGSRLRRLALGGLTRWVSRRVDVVRALYPQQIAQLVAVGVPPARITLVRNRCDSSVFAPARWLGERAGLRASLGIEDQWLMLFTGSLLPVKGVDVAIRALPAILERRPDAMLVLAGDGPERARLAALAESLGVAGRVRFLGNVPHSRVPGLLAAADLFLFPSFSEASPRAVIEASAMACPIVATTVGGIPDILADQQSGLLVPPGEPTLLARAVIAMAEDPALRLKLGAGARAAALSKFEYRRNLDALRALYRRTAGAG